jgi:hypothetical protein
LLAGRAAPESSDRLVLTADAVVAVVVVVVVVAGPDADTGADAPRFAADPPLLDLRLNQPRQLMSPAPAVHYYSRARRRGVCRVVSGSVVRRGVVGCEREQGGVVEGPLLDRGRAGGRGRGFLLVRRVRLRGNAVWTGSVSDGWMGTALPLIWAGVDASSRGRNRSSVCVCQEQGRIMLCSRHGAGWLWLGLSRQLPLPTAEGFRHSVAVPHEMVLVLRFSGEAVPKKVLAR